MPRLSPRGYAASAVGYFALGMLTDLGVTLYYRTVSSHMLWQASVLSFLVTLVPLFVAERGITTKRRSLFLFYALGCAAGTAAGMMVRLP